MTLNTDPGARSDCMAAVRPKVLAMDTTWKSVRLRSHCSAAARGGGVSTLLSCLSPDHERKAKQCVSVVTRYRKCCIACLSVASKMCPSPVTIIP